MQNVNQSCQPAVMILRMPQLKKKLGMSRSSIYAKMKKGAPGYDGSFPEPVKLGKTAVGWIESEVDQWIMNQRGH